MFLKKLFSHSLIYALGPQIPKFAGLFVLPVITRYLTSTDYGIYGVITSYVGILTAISDLGFSVVLVNSFYNYPRKWTIVWRQLHFYLIVWSVIYGFFLAVLLYFVMPVSARGNMFEIIAFVCIPSMFFNSTVIIGSRYYQVAQKPLFISVTSAIVGVVAIALNLYTIAVLKLGYMGWFISTFLSSLLQFSFFLYPVFFKYNIKPLIAYRKIFLKANLKISLPIVPHTYSSYLLNSSDRLVMDRIHLPVAEIGKYNLAYTFGNYFDFFGGAIGMAIGPIYTKLFSKRSKEKDEQVHFLTHWLQFFFIIGGFLLSLWCKEIFDLLISNPELKGVYPVAIIILMGYAYRPYYWTAITRLQYSENTSQLWKISFTAGILNLLLNIIFIPFFGIMAAATTTFFALLYMGFAGFFLKAFRKVEAMKYYPVSVMFLIVVSTVLAYSLKDVHIVIKAVLSLALILSYIAYSWLVRKRFMAIEA